MKRAGDAGDGARRETGNKSSMKRDSSKAAAAEVTGAAGEEKGKERATSVAKANILVDQPATVTGRTGGVYIPPFKLAQMQKDAAAMGKATKEYQRIAWEALRKSINGLINKASINPVGRR